MVDSYSAGIGILLAGEVTDQAAWLVIRRNLLDSIRRNLLDSIRRNLLDSILQDGVFRFGVCALDRWCIVSRLTSVLRDLTP